MKVKIIAVASLALSAVFVLAGCANANDSKPLQTSSADTEGGIGSVGVENVLLPDGRHVLCVSNWEMSHGGLSCDWANAK